MSEMLTPEEAQRTILDRIRPLGMERVPLLEAMGRILAEDIRARYDNPPLDNSAMDGFAVRYSDVRGATPRPTRRPGCDRRYPSRARRRKDRRSWPDQPHHDRGPSAPRSRHGSSCRGHPPMDPGSSSWNRKRKMPTSVTAAKTFGPGPL